MPRKRSKTDHDGAATNPADLLLQRLELSFKEKRGQGRAIAALRAFRLAITLQQPLPQWVVHFLNAAIGEVLDVPDTSMDRALGLVPGRGQSKGMDTEAAEGRDFFLMHDIWRLARLGVSVERAAEMVQAKQEHQGAQWQVGAGKAKILNAGTLEARYVREHWEARIAELYASIGKKEISDADNIEFLRGFPQDDRFAPELKSFISHHSKGRAKSR